MDVQRRKLRALLALLVLSGAAGCASTATVQNDLAMINYSGIPRELDKATLPEYRVEPPDILLIEAVNNIRTADAPLNVGDSLEIRLGNPEPLLLGFEDDPAVPPSQAELLQSQYHLEKEVRDKYLDGEFVIQPGGLVNLGPVYGSVQVEGLTLAEAKAAIEQHLQAYTRDEMGNPVGLRAPQITVNLPTIAGKQAISGEHLVRPDGTVALGIYGSVYVAGMSLDEARFTVEQHMARFIDNPEVNVDVLSYNSKFVYVITDGGGFGEQVVKVPVTGNETVLDAIAQIQGLSQVSSKKIWVARPAPAGTDAGQIMDVHWSAITREGITTTNYQLFPGDRIYIQADKMIHTDNFIAKTIAPFERLFGFVLLGSGVQSQLRFIHLNNRGGGGGP